MNVTCCILCIQLISIFRDSMSVDYAAGLSHYDDLGDCGSEEIIDEKETVKDKVKTLANLLKQHEGSCVVHAGAGISTSAGIRDFRGKGGVWTELLESQRSQPEKETKYDIKQDSGESKNRDAKIRIVKPFDQTEPTFAHLALKQLCTQGFISHIVSQNVDGLFLKSGLPRKFISELHGNFYLDECTKCRSRFIRSSASQTMRLTKSVIKCPREGVNCRGHLRDTILDWESPIPYNELRVATRESKRASLHICIGTSLQLRPSKDLVCDPTKNSNKKLVIINLQATKLNEKANLVINYYADDVMKELTSLLGLEIDLYDAAIDPTKDSASIGALWSK